MSSGLFSAYINDGNSDYIRIKAKGGVLIDFDLDGDLDLSYGYSTSYYFKNEEGVYERVDIDNQGARGMVAGDIDNNGYPDLLKWRFQEYDAIDSLLYKNDEELYRTRMNHHLLMNSGSHEFNTLIYLQEQQLPFMHSQGLIDVDLDGDLDIVAIEKEGDEQFYIFRNDGFDEQGNIILEEVFSHVQTDGSTSRTLAIVDYDNDGDQDVYIPRKYGINWLFENQTLSGTYDNVVYNPNPSHLFTEVAINKNVADDSFGDLRSTWGMEQRGEIMIMIMIMTCIFQIGALIGCLEMIMVHLQDVTSTYSNVYSDSLSNGASWGDFNNDGYIDLWAGNIRIRDDVFIILVNLNGVIKKVLNF